MQIRRIFTSSWHSLRACVCVCVRVGVRVSVVLYGCPHVVFFNAIKAKASLFYSNIFPIPKSSFYRKRLKRDKIVSLIICPFSLSIQAPSDSSMQGLSIYNVPDGLFNLCLSIYSALFCLFLYEAYFLSALKYYGVYLQPLGALCVTVNFLCNVVRRCF